MPPAGPGGAPDHAAPAARWEFFILAGDPRRPELGASYKSEVSASGWITAPDNVAFDLQGRIWIATDQGTNWERLSGTTDGLYGCEVAGPDRGAPKLFYRVPVGAEMCGPCFTPDGETVFLAIPDMKPVMQMKVKFNLKAADGAPVSQEIYNTIHKLAEK